MNSSSAAMLVVSLTTVHASPVSLSFCGAMAAVGCSPLPARYTSPSALKPRYGSWRMAALTAGAGADIRGQLPFGRRVRDQHAVLLHDGHEALGLDDGP